MITRFAPLMVLAALLLLPSAGADDGAQSTPASSAGGGGCMPSGWGPNLVEGIVGFTKCVLGVTSLA